MRRVFVIDIDGTLAYNNVAMSLELCNEFYRIGLSAERLRGLSRAAFLQLPEVMRKRDEVGTRQFDHEFSWMDYHPYALLAGIVVPGAVAGVEKLSQLGEVVYYTARYSRDRVRHGGIVAATHQWLELHQFHRAYEVVFCDGIVDKARRLAELVDTGCQVVAVDDSYERLLEHTRSDAFPRDRFTLVGLRAPFLTEELLPLKNWHYIDQLIIQLQDRQKEQDK